MSIQEVAPEQLAQLFHRYHQALAPYLDRKSTRLNSSHRCISYAVFCHHLASTLVPYTTLFRSLSVHSVPLSETFRPRAALQITEIPNNAVFTRLRRGNI